MKMYFKGIEGIEKPVDFNGIEIQVGDILTRDSFDDVFDEKFYNTHYPTWTKEDIESSKHRATYKVKCNEKGFFYAEGINQELYLHDFRFKHTKVVL